MNPLNSLLVDLTYLFTVFLRASLVFISLEGQM